MIQENAKEYFKLKRVIKEMNADIRDLKKNNELSEEITSLMEKVKELRAELMSVQVIAELKDELDTAKERLKLLKDIIKQELMEGNQKEITIEGRKIKLVSVLKEVREEESEGGDSSENIEINEGLETIK